MTEMTWDAPGVTWDMPGLFWDSPTIPGSTGDGGTTPTVGTYFVTDLLRDIRQQLDSGQYGTLNKLQGGLNNTATSVTFKFAPNGAGQGTRIGIGLEDFYIWSLSGQVAQVERGFGDTTVSAHSDGDLIRVAPRWSDAELLRAANQELAGLPSKGLFNVKTADFVADNILWGYPLPADMIATDVLGLSWLEKSVIEYRPPIDNYRVEFNVPTDEFPTGNALYLTDRPTPGQNFRVTYASGFNQLATYSDDVSGVSSIPASALDLLAMGAAMRCMAGRPVRRADFITQGDGRRAAEASTNEVLGSIAELRNQYQTRLNDEITRLVGAYSPTLLRRSIRLL